MRGRLSSRCGQGRSDAMARDSRPSEGHRLACMDFLLVAGGQAMTVFPAQLSGGSVGFLDSVRQRAHAQEIRKIACIHRSSLAGGICYS